MSAGFPLPAVLTNWSTFRRTWCCNHSNPVSRWRILPSPRLDAMPFDALTVRCDTHHPFVAEVARQRLHADPDAAALDVSHVLSLT